MAKNRLDLTGLGNLAALTEGNETSSNGEPLELALADVIEDADQPRKFFSETAIESLSAQIRATKVRTPISVKPKNADGKYIINHGARRYRASILAGKTTIPAFIDQSYDDYDQAAENIQREDLTPLEIAIFIQKRIANGDKKGYIASKLGQKSSFISEHLSLINAPEFIQVLARDKSVGVRTLYDLAKAHDDFPADAEAYVASTEEVTRAGVAALIQNLKGLKLQSELQSNSDVIESSGTLQTNVQQHVFDQTKTSANGSDDGDDSDAARSRVISPTSNIADGNKVTESSRSVMAKTNEAVKKLVIVVKNGERIATVMHSSKIEIIYKDTGEVAKIDLAMVDVVGTELQHENSTYPS
jgi:ParB family chromosome partitioning protein